MATLMALCAMLAGAACASLGVGFEGPGLRDLAAYHRLDIGAAVAIRPLETEPAYRAALVHNCSIITPENAMKFSIIHPHPHTYAFAQGDAIVAFAEKHGMRVRGHTLVWHNQLPAWVTSQSRTRKQWIALLRDHITTVVSHYRGRIYAWDVVNEAMDDRGRLRRTVWLKNIGPDYIAMAFRWAHEADPNAKLFYNDYGERNERKQKAIYRLVRRLVRSGVPIQGVGLQMHMSLAHPPRPSDVARAITRMHRLGLETEVTEMDVAIRKPFTEQKLGRQAELYRRMMRTCLTTKGCDAFLTWGISDRHSWIPRARPGYGAGLLLDRNYKSKPAYRAVSDALSRR